MTAATKVLVTRLDDDGSRHRQPVIAERSLAAVSASNGRPRRAPIESVAFPSEKFAVLREVNDGFRVAWEHRRKPESGDTSLSGYDCALAACAAHAEWTDPEIKALIEAHRREYGDEDDIKKAHRPSYIAATIAKAREGAPEPAEKVQPDTLEQEQSETDDVAGDEFQTPDGGQSMPPLEYVKRRIGVEITKVERTVGTGRRSRWHFTVTHRRGHAVRMAPIEGHHVIEANFMRKEIWEGTGKPIAKLTDAEWAPIAEALDHAAVLRDTGDSDALRWTELLAGFVRGELGEEDRKDITDPKVKTKVIEEALPYFLDMDGRLWVHQQSFANHLRNFEKIYPKKDEIGNGLTDMAWENKQITAHSPKAGKNRSRRYYHSPGAWEAE